MTQFQVFISSILVLTQIFILVVAAFVMFYAANLVRVQSEIGTVNSILIFSSLYSNLFFCASMIMIMSSAFYQLHNLNTLLMQLVENRQGLTTIQIIKRTAIMFDIICDIFDGISGYYLVNISNFLLGFSYFNIFFFYSVYMNFKHPNEFLISSMIWILYYSPFVLWMTTLASRIGLEGQKTADLIHHIVNKEMNPKTLRKSNLLVQQVFHRIPRISCGLFELNWKFFLYLTGFIFSFSVILIQFYDILKS